MFGPAMRTVHLAITDFMCQAQLAAEEFIHQNDQVRAIWSSFPSGCEEHIKVMGPVNGNHVRINARIQTNAELMRLFLATDAVRRMGAKSVSLFIPYLPYARQDRVCNPGEALSASVMAKNASKTHCPKGHPYDELNTTFRRGSRECKKCVKARESLYRSSDAYREKMRNKYAKNKIHDKRN